MKGKEKEFYELLENLFVGARVEGVSGYANLINIKSKYYKELLKPELEKDIQSLLKEYPDLRDELFEKLYTFFSAFFSEAGSVYYRYAPFHLKVYERVYMDSRDMALFWKTRGLFYIKTDMLIKSIPVEVDGFKFYFDASEVEHKKANEKRELIFDFKEVREDKTIVLKVEYSEMGKKTKEEEILKHIKKHLRDIRADTLEKAIRTFSSQTRVDYFINGNPRKFLKEQFDMWLYQYVFLSESEWTDRRIKQIQGIRNIAYRLIDFVSQFEEEILKIWQKPKFVLNSGYVISLDRLESKGAYELIKKLQEHSGWEAQVKEWLELEILKEKPDDLFENTLNGKRLKKEYRFLPIDTKYFKDLEPDILALFEELDRELDGWLIKSENWQAMNSILPKFKGKVQTIYIDPPFNTGDDFHYEDKYQDSTWITLIENRLELGKQFLVENGVLFLHLDHNANYIAKFVLQELFENIQEIIWNTDSTRDDESGVFGFKSFGHKFARQHDTIYLCSTDEKYKFIKLWKPNRRETKLGIGWLDILSKPKVNRPERMSDYTFYIEKYDDSCILKMLNIDIGNEKIYPVGDVWNDVYAFTQSELRTSENFSFRTQKPEGLLRRIIQSTTEAGDLVLDFFCGSGTTLAVAHKLKRKWIGVEVDRQIFELALRRMKIVLYGDKEYMFNGKRRYSHLSRDINYCGGGFFKYYELEQFEDTLRNAKYQDRDLFVDPYKDPYNAYIFMRDEKLLEGFEIDYKANKVKFMPEKIYKNIDLAETLSNLLGKWIKKLDKDLLEFEDGEKIDLKDIDYRIVRPLVWWK